MKTIYIPGHKGFLGRKVLSHFKRKYNVITFDREEKNLLNQDDVKSIFENNKIDIVINCAAVVGGINAQDDYRFLLENLTIQNNLIDNAVKNNVETFVNLGSSCIYPKDYKQPLKEEYILKDVPEKTNEGYSLAKICGLKLCEYANKKYDTNFISLMPPNLYGVGDDLDLKKSHVLSATIKKVIEADKEVVVWGSGKPKREFLYIDDLIDCIEWSIKNIKKTDTFLNVGTGKDISIDNLTKLVAKILNKKIKIVHDKTKPDGMMRKCLDVSKINKLGWKYKTSLEDGIKKTIEWMDDKINK